MTYLVKSDTNPTKLGIRTIKIQHAPNSYNIYDFKNENFHLNSNRLEYSFSHSLKIFNQIINLSLGINLGMRPIRNYYDIDVIVTYM